MIFNSPIRLLLLHFFTLSSAAQQAVLSNGTPNPLNAQFARLVDKSLKLWHVPGVAIAVVDGDDVWAEGYGISSFPSTPVTAETLFYTGSTTKAFTAAAMSLLISSGNYSELAWDTPISSLIRENFVLADPYFTEHVTVEDACSHRTGLPSHDWSYGGKNPDGEMRGVLDAVKSLANLPLTAGLRTRFQYCNPMYVVVSYVIEKLTGIWLGDFLRERIWVPLGMKSTYFSTRAAKSAPETLAQGYVYSKEEYHAVPYMDTTVVSGAGSVVSNVLDYSKWLQALLSSSGPLSKADYSALFTPRTLLPPINEPSPYTGPQAYSLGWFTGTYQGYEFFEHSGGLEAFGAQLIFFPSISYGLVAFGNTGTTSNAAEQVLIWHLIDEKLNIPPEKRFDYNKRNLARLSRKESISKNATQIYYPNVPSPPLQLSLPLNNYTGVYAHPAYHSVIITLNPETSELYVDRSNAAWSAEMNLEHVSGEYFIAWTDSKAAPGWSAFKGAAPAQFTVSSNGVVGAFGVALEPEMGDEGRIWFERVA